MRFDPRLSHDTATLLLLAIFIIALLGLADQAGSGPGEHAEEISVFGAVLLLFVYVVWVWSYLRKGARAHRGHVVSAGAIPLRTSIVLIFVAGLAATFVSEWLVHAIDPAVDALGISRAFTGLVIVAIAGNAVENAVAVTSAWKGNNDLTLAIVNNAVSQTAVVVFPALVLTAVAVWQMTGDGEAVGFEGWALIAFFAILAAFTWYA